MPIHGQEERVNSLIISALFGSGFGAVGSATFIIAEAVRSGSSLASGVAVAALMALAGAGFGAFVGLLCAPALDFARTRHATRSYLRQIVLCTCIGSTVCCGLSPRFGGPLVGMVFAGGFYVALCYVVGRRAEREWIRRTDRSHCPQCAYSTEGLPVPTCPECGHAHVLASAGTTGRERDRRR